VYRHCIFCQRDLGQNEVVEAFPVGRRLAFDSSKGRLWVVCRHCARWNLTPMEERWEIIEECERMFRSTSTRISTTEIGLARVREGLELVRIGRPLLPEFAGWRYGDQFGRRQRRVIVGSITALGAAGLSVWSASVGVTTLVLFPLYLFATARITRVNYGSVQVVSNMGTKLDVSAMAMDLHTLRSGGGKPGSWQLEVVHAGGTTILTGHEAVHALTKLLPNMNPGGATRSRVAHAVAAVEREGGPSHFFAAVQEAGRKLQADNCQIARLPDVLRLGLEIAANEEAERRALLGELTLLNTAWQLAEEIAAIADGLLMPEAIRSRVNRFKKEGGTGIG